MSGKCDIIFYDVSNTSFVCRVDMMSLGALSGLRYHTCDRYIVAFVLLHWVHILHVGYVTSFIALMC